jgi:hypothetical protein
MIRVRAQNEAAPARVVLSAHWVTKGGWHADESGRGPVLACAGAIVSTDVTISLLLFHPSPGPVSICIGQARSWFLFLCNVCCIRVGGTVLIFIFIFIFTLLLLPPPSCSFICSQSLSSETEPGGTGRAGSEVVERGLCKMQSTELQVYQAWRQVEVCTTIQGWH